MTKERVVKLLKERLPEIRQRFEVDRISLFGSIARGEARVLEYTQSLTQAELIRDRKTYDILWDVVRNKIPSLVATVGKYLQGR